MINGTQYEWTGYDDFGAYFDMDCNTEPWKGHIKKSISLIIKGHVGWGTKSSDTFIPLALYLKRAEPVGGRLMAQIYCADGNGDNIDTFYSAEEALQDNFRTIKATTDWKSFQVTATARPATEIKCYKFTQEYYRLYEAQRIQQKENFLFQTFTQPTSASFKLTLKEDIDPQCDYLFETNFDSSKPKLIKSRYGTMENLFDTSRFVSNYTYSGKDLGVAYYSDRTEFRLWAPTTVQAQVIIYMSPNSSSYIDYDPTASDGKKKVVELTKQEKGVWSVAVPGDWDGFGYTYRLYHDGEEVETIDPYVRAVGANGERGAIVDFSKTNPEGWASTKRPQMTFSQLSTYEVHVRDFTADETWVSNKGNAHGTFNAFAEEGTTYKGVTTGFDHIKELGVNAVQLLPAFDYDNQEFTIVDDVNGKVIEPGYNWGYNPQNYNCVEGVYSSNPFNPYTRIIEYKQLIKKLADNGIGTIMDVVYNHVSSLAQSPMTKTVPMYYFYYTANGSSYDMTGCGNSVNSSRIMTQYFIRDSLSWWASEYKIKGFRFDLMGCLECDAMRMAKDELYGIDKTIVMYGEGWRSGDGRAAKSADTYNVYKYLKDNGKGSVGCFNDTARNGWKGETVWGSGMPTTENIFMNSSSPSEDAVWNSATMFIGENRAHKSASFPTPASQSVNYLACHDNYTLYDHMNYALHGVYDRSQWITENADTRAAVLALESAVVMSQGNAFLHGGDEFYRQKIMDKNDPMYEEMRQVDDDGFQATASKWVMRNSYKYGDAVNSFKWNRKATFKNDVAKLANLIKFRNANLGTLFGKSDNVDTDFGCWVDGTGAGVPALGAWAVGGGKAINILVAGNSNNAELPIAPGTYEIIYSSTGRTSFTSSGTVKLDRFECLVVYGK